MFLIQFPSNDWKHLRVIMRARGRERETWWQWISDDEHRKLDLPVKQRRNNTPEWSAKLSSSPSLSAFLISSFTLGQQHFPSYSALGHTEIAHVLTFFSRHVFILLRVLWFKSFDNQDFFVSCLVRFRFMTGWLF